MREGLLWFDNNPNRQLIDKVSRAATRYQAKFGRQPTTCFVNPAEFDDQVQEIDGIRVRPVTNMLRHHLWIGIENDKALAKAV